MIDLPDPLVPPECDLRGYPWMPLDVRRLLTSETWVLGTSEQKVAAFTLCCESWCQVPGGSLSSDDRMLAHLSGAGAAWKRVREHALRGWVKCSDGRLYHPVVAEKAREAWDRKLTMYARTEAARAARDAKRQKPADDAPPSLTTTLNNDVTEPVVVSVTEPVIDAKISKQILQEQEVRKDPQASPSDAARLPTAVDLLWQFGLPILAQLTGKSPRVCRSLLGKLRQAMRDDCPKLLALLQEADAMRPTDPVAWLSAAAGMRQLDTPPGRRPASNGAVELLLRARERAAAEPGFTLQTEIAHDLPH